MIGKIFAQLDNEFLRYGVPNDYKFCPKILRAQIN